MDANELRARQAPLDERNRDVSGDAALTLHAAGLLGDGVACSVDAGRAMVEAGRPPGDRRQRAATGGNGLRVLRRHAPAGARCVRGVTMKLVAPSLGIEVAGMVHADGDLDGRGTLGVDQTAPVGFTDIHLSFGLVTDAPAEQPATLVRQAERFCIVFQTLAISPALTVSVS